MKLRLIALATITAATMTYTSAQYKITVPLSEDEDGAMAYLVDYDNGSNIDSTLVANQKAVFTGSVPASVAARLIIDGNRYGNLILENAEITYNPATREATGSPLNELLTSLNVKSAEIGQKYNAATTKEEKDSLATEFENFADDLMWENINNPVGYMLYLNEAYEMSFDELKLDMDLHPYLANSVRLKNLLDAKNRKLATSEGSKYVDFEIEYQGEKHKLSDVVGKGDYVLVDFWASWCGPCIRQTAVIKDIYKEFAPVGLKVLGVAVWDEPQNTERAIQQHELPWPCWLNGGNVPTDAYGISGIPCIILFGPDGTILSRDKQSEELVADVRAAMEKAGK